MNEMKSNKQKKREEMARQAKKLQAQAAYLQENKAWNWVWPGPSDGALLMDTQPLPRNCWFTGLASSNGYSKSPSGDELLGTHPYYGPSKSTVGGREARRGGRHKLTWAEEKKRSKGGDRGRVTGC